MMSVQATDSSLASLAGQTESCQVKALKSVIDELSSLELSGVDQLSPERVEEIIGDARIDAGCSFDFFPRSLIKLREDALSRIKDEHYGRVNFGITWMLVSLERALQKAV